MHTAPTARAENASQQPENPSNEAQQPPYQLNTIKITYHPRTKRPEKLISLEDYRHQASASKAAGSSAASKPPSSTPPWCPFSTRGDFELAEIVLAAGMNQTQIDTLFKLIHRIASGKAQVTLQTHKDLRKAWDDAAYHQVPVYNAFVS